MPAFLCTPYQSLVSRGQGVGGSTKGSSLSTGALGMPLLGSSRLVFIFTGHLNGLCQIPFSLFRFPSVIHCFSHCSRSLIFLKILILILRPSAIPTSCVCFMFMLLFKVKDFTSCPLCLPVLGRWHNVMAKKASSIGTLLVGVWLFPLSCSCVALGTSLYLCVAKYNITWVLWKGQTLICCED